MKYIRKKLLSILLLLLFLGSVIGAAFTESGRVELQENAGKSALTVPMPEEMKQFLNSEENNVSWQENWIALDGRVYQYEEELINLLFLGIDRHGEIEEQTEYVTWEMGQADAIFLLSINPKKKTVKIVGIPRNAMVDLEIYDDKGQVREIIYNQICLQYPYACGGENGMEETKKDVSTIFYDLPIHGVFAIGLDAITEVNDELGGVEVEVLEDLTKFDKKLVKGERVQLMGKSAYLYVQKRDINIKGSTKTRFARQKQYLAEMMKKAKQLARENPMLVPTLYQTCQPYMATDISLNEAVYLAGQAFSCEFDAEGGIYLLEGKDAYNEGITANGKKNLYNDLYISKESINSIMRQVFCEEVYVP